MEIDLQRPTPSFPRSNYFSLRSMKRSRSPDSQVDRPSKRASLSAMNHLTISMPPSPFVFDRGANEILPDDSTTTMIAEESWIVQTRGLCIASPVSAISDQDQQSTPACEPIQEQEGDIGMDCDSLTKSPRSSLRSYNAFIQDTHLQYIRNISTPPPYVFSPADRGSGAQSFRFSNISIQPATPSETPGANDSYMSACSPSPNSLNVPEVADITLTRKPKFTMGPKVDCEKCRLGIKGHWMHID